MTKLGLGVKGHFSMVLKHPYINIYINIKIKVNEIYTLHERYLTVLYFRPWACPRTYLKGWWRRATRFQRRSRGKPSRSSWTGRIRSPWLGPGPVRLPASCCRSSRSWRAGRPRAGPEPSSSPLPGSSPYRPSGSPRSWAGLQVNVSLK